MTMDWQQFLEKVEAMRKAQREFFELRTNLKIAKKLEREVDQAIAELRSIGDTPTTRPQGELFEKGGEGYR